MRLAAGQVHAQDQRVVFEKDILPIRQVRCLKCHGEGKLQGELDLRRRFTILRGSDGGPVLVPGQTGQSLLLQGTDKDEMPPA